MTQVIQHDIECPKCKTRQCMELCLSLNVTLDPSLRDKLLEGEINLFTCEKCGESGHVDCPILYHDMDLEFCVQYHLEEELEEPDLYEMYRCDGTQRATDQLGMEAGYLNTPHVVFSMNELVRYVVFRQRLAEAVPKQP